MKMNPALITTPSAPQRHYHIPMTPPKICRAMLLRPPYITAANYTQDQNSTADSEESSTDYNTVSPQDTTTYP